MQEIVHDSLLTPPEALQRSSGIAFGLGSAGFSGISNERQPVYAFCYTGRLLIRHQDDPCSVAFGQLCVWPDPTEVYPMDRPPTQLLQPTQDLDWTKTIPSFARAA